MTTSHTLALTTLRTNLALGGWPWFAIFNQEERRAMTTNEPCTTEPDIEPTTRLDELRAERRQLAAKQLREMRQRIREFDERCKANEHTDTGEAWDLLYWLRGRCAIIARKLEG